MENQLQVLANCIHVHRFQLSSSEISLLIVWERDITGKENATREQRIHPNTQVDFCSSGLKLPHNWNNVSCFLARQFTCISSFVTELHKPRISLPLTQRDHITRNPQWLRFSPEAFLTKTINSFRTFWLTRVSETSLTDKEQSIQADFHWCRTQFCLQSCTGEQAAAASGSDTSPPTAGWFPGGTDKAWKRHSFKRINLIILLKRTSLPTRTTFNYGTFKLLIVSQHYKYCKKNPKSRVETLFPSLYCVHMFRCSAHV